MPTPNDRHAIFRQLHESGIFVMPNPWDIGAARLLAQLGFPALATTSSGFAWSLGRPDNHVTLDEALAHLRAMSSAVDLPLNADFEGGFALQPADVARNVTAATSTGVAGLSIEDSTGDAANPLYDFALAVDRVRAARHAIDDSGTGVLLTGRSEGFIVGRPDLRATIRRLTAFADAGADCLFAPGLRSIDDIKAVVDAVAPKPGNVRVGSDSTTVAGLAEAGVGQVELVRQMIVDRIGQAQLASLDLLHDRDPRERLGDRADAEQRLLRIDLAARLDAVDPVAFDQQRLAVANDRDLRAGDATLGHDRAGHAVHERLERRYRLRTRRRRLDRFSGRCGLGHSDARRHRQDQVRGAEQALRPRFHCYPLGCRDRDDTLPSPART